MPERVKVEKTDTPKRVKVESKVDPTIPVSRLDELENLENKRDWTSIFKSMNPTKMAFWNSVNKNTWDTVSGIIDLVAPYREPTEEERDKAFADAARAGKALPEAQKARDDLKVKWQIPLIISFAGQVGKEILSLGDEKSVSPVEAYKLSRMSREQQMEWTKNREKKETPILDEIWEYVTTTTGAKAVFGNDIDKQEFYQLVEEDPLAFWGWVLPIIGQLKNVKAATGAGKIAKTGEKSAQIAGRTADIIDQPLLEGTTLFGESLVKFKNRGLDKDAYNQPFEAVSGRDPKTGEDIKSTVTPEEIATRSDLNPDDVPIKGLTDSEAAQAREKQTMKLEGEKGDAVVSRFEKTEEAIQDSLDDIVRRADKQFGNIESYDINKVGETFRNRYEEWQSGQKLWSEEVFSKIQGTLDKPLKFKDEFPIFANTQKLLSEMKGQPGANAIPDAEIDKIDSILSDAFKQVATDETLTLADVDAIPRRFRERIKQEFRKEGLYSIGTDHPASKIYAQLREDAYDLLEHEISVSPNDFPSDFLKTVQDTRLKYRAILDMENRNAATLIRNNFNSPHKIVDHIIKPDTPIQDILDIKEILGTENWNQMQAGLLQRVIDLSDSTTGFKWNGLQKRINTINKTDKNRLRTVFGDEQAKELTEFAEWSARFGTPTPAKKGLINSMVRSENLTTFLNRIAYIIPVGGVGYGAGAANLAPTAISIAAAATIYLGARKWDNFLNSDAGRKWMLEGHSWKVMTKSGKEIEIKPGHFREAIDRYKVRGMLQVPKHVGKSEEKEKKRKPIIVDKNTQDFLNNIGRDERQLLQLR